MKTYKVLITFPNAARNFELEGTLDHIREVTLREWDKLKGGQNVWEQIFDIVPPLVEHRDELIEEALYSAYAAWESSLEDNFTIEDCCEILSEDGGSYEIVEIPDESTQSCDHCHNDLTDSVLMERAKVIFLRGSAEYWCGSCIELEDEISRQEGHIWDEDTDTWLDETREFLRRYEDLPTDNTQL